MRIIEPQGMLLCANDAIGRVKPLVIENPTKLTPDEMIRVQDHPNELMSIFYYIALDMLLLLSSHLY